MAASTPAGRPWVGVGAVAHGAVGLALVPLGLVAPAWAVLVLLVVWAALLAVAVRRRAGCPLLFLAAPLATAAITAATLYLGGTYLRWRPPALSSRTPLGRRRPDG